MSLTTTDLLSQLTEDDSFPERPTRFRVQGIWESRQETVRYELTIDHARQEWTARDLTNGVDSSFRDGTLTTGVERSPSRSYRARVTNTPLQLLFPEHLPVWGRPSRDTDTPIEIEYIGDGHSLVLLKSLQDPALRKTLVVDNRTGLVIRFYDSLAVTVLENFIPF